MDALQMSSGYRYMPAHDQRELQAIFTRAKEQERQKVAEQLAQEYASKEKALKRKAAEALEVKEDIISYLIPPKSAKNDYMEQKPAKYVFKCRDGDIQIPDYGIFRTDFYYKERISNDTKVKKIQVNTLIFHRLS